MKPIYIVGAKRTPMGNLLGNLSPVTAPQLGAAAIQAAVAQANLTGDKIQEVIMGCVLTAGQGQAPARQAAIYADIAQHVGATTINKMCGSGMKAAMLAHDLVQAGTNEVMVAGGMESMSNAPYLLKKARAGYRLGHGELFDHMFLDGLEDAYQPGALMGVFAEQCARHFHFTREQQDAFAIESLKRAQAAAASGALLAEITPVTYTVKQETISVVTDENPSKAKLEKIPQLKPSFAKNGTITPANASSISDGAAALVLADAAYVEKHQLQPLAKIIGHASFAQAPEWFTTAPIGAVKQLLHKINWQLDEVDLFEINEAFAVVTMAAMHELKIPHDKVNIYGGACAIGHPIGASGARIMVTLLNALRNTGGNKGIATLCIGGGEATALALELCA